MTITLNNGTSIKVKRGTSVTFTKMMKVGGSKHFHWHLRLTRQGAKVPQYIYIRNVMAIITPKRKEATHAMNTKV